MSRIRLTLNGEAVEADLAPDQPLLWALRDHWQLTGTRFSCGRGLCGSCTVLIDGRPRRSCVTPISRVEGKSVITIEGLPGPEEHPVQKAWIEEQVPQCGYCQPGQILNATALIEGDEELTDETITRSMDRVLCRCGTYQRIRKAIERAAEEVGRD